MSDIADRILEFLISMLFLVMIFIVISMNIEIKRINRAYEDNMKDHNSTIQIQLFK